MVDQAVVEEPLAKRPKVENGKPRSEYICDAHEAVSFRAVSCRTAETLEQEIAAGGKAFKAEFLHQHFGEDEQIKGYQGLQINIWLHIQTYHTWVDIKYTRRRPGSDKLDKLFAEHFPEGTSASKDSFVQEVIEAATQMPDLYALGETVGRVTGKDGNEALLKRHNVAKGHAAVRVSCVPPEAQSAVSDPDPIRSLPCPQSLLCSA